MCGMRAIFPAEDEYFLYLLDTYGKQQCSFRFRSLHLSVVNVNC